MLFDYIGVPKTYCRLSFLVPASPPPPRGFGEGLDAGASATLVNYATIEGKEVAILTKITAGEFLQLRGKTIEVTFWYQRGRRGGKIRTRVTDFATGE